jgi:tetratricopeptide (TPR) repeat protein
MHRILGLALDVPTTDRLVWDAYRYAGLARDVSNQLEPTAAGVANNLSLPFSQLAYAYEARGDRERAIKNLNRAAQLSTNPALRRALMSMLARPPGDSGP